MRALPRSVYLEGFYRVWEDGKMEKKFSGVKKVLVKSVGTYRAH